MKNQFGRHIRALRGGRPRREIAEAAGIHEQTLVHLELGRHLPRPSTIARLASALGADPAALLAELVQDDAPPARAAAR